MPSSAHHPRLRKSALSLKQALGALVALVLVGCTPSGGRLLGVEPAAAPALTVAMLKTTTAPFTLSGTMTDKCPTAACWFHFKDATGAVKVDVKAAGFTVTDIPNGAPLRVFGSYNKESGEVEATGLRW